MDGREIVQLKKLQMWEWGAICTLRSQGRVEGRGSCARGGINLVHVPGGTESIEANGRRYTDWWQSAEVSAIAFFYFPCKVGGAPSVEKVGGLRTVE